MRLAVAIVLTLSLVAGGCSNERPHIREPLVVCAAHGGVKSVAIHYQGYPGEEQDTLCNDGYFKVEP